MKGKRIKAKSVGQSAKGRAHGAGRMTKKRRTAYGARRRIKGAKNMAGVRKKTGVRQKVYGLG